MDSIQWIFEGTLYETNIMTYDGSGKLLMISIFGKGGVLKRQDSLFYDSSGRLVETRGYEPSLPQGKIVYLYGSGTDTIGKIKIGPRGDTGSTHSYEYGENGFVSETRDRNFLFGQHASTLHTRYYYGNDSIVDSTVITSEDGQIMEKSIVTYFNRNTMRIERQDGSLPPYVETETIELGCNGNKIKSVRKAGGKTTFRESWEYDSNGLVTNWFYSGRGTTGEFRYFRSRH